MQRFIKVNSLLLLLGVFLFSCDTTNSPVTDLSQNTKELANNFTIENQYPYELNYVSTIGARVKVEDGIFDQVNETTTFKFTVLNTIPTGIGNRTLKSFSLKLPSCYDAPVYTPDLGSESSIENSILKWNVNFSAAPSVGENPQEFTITYPGNIPLGEILASAERDGSSGHIYSGMIAGPVCPTVLPELTFSGSVYIDANEDDIKQPEEYGLENIEVRLYSFNGEDETFTFIDSVITEEDGEFSLTVNSSGGDFRIKVPANKVDNTYYQAIPVTFLDFTDVTEDVEDIHFAYVLNTEQIIADLLSGDIQKNTRSTQYWAFQLQHAGINRAQVHRNPNVDYTRDQMNELLTLIENTLPNVPEPFKFGPNKIQDALRILRGQKYGDSEVSELMKELLTAELNVMSNKGAFTIEGDEIILNDPFNRAILIFGEAIACNALGTCPVAKNAFKSLASVNGTYAPGVLSHATISSGTQTLSAFNGTGGIGSK
jgi:hypothetical protein